MSADLLEEIHLLSNLERDDDKLLQVVSVGQPELDETWIPLVLDNSNNELRVADSLVGWLLTKQIGTSTGGLQIAGESLCPDPLLSTQPILNELQAAL